MLVRDIHGCRRFIALDGTNICELLHPDREEEDLMMGCSIAHASLEPGEASRPHLLKSSSEVYYILEGEGVMHIAGESARVRPGHAVYVPPGSRQQIENTGDKTLTFLCIVFPMWRSRDEELL